MLSIKQIAHTAKMHAGLTISLVKLYKPVIVGAQPTTQPKGKMPTSDSLDGNTNQDSPQPAADAVRIVEGNSVDVADADVMAELGKLQDTKATWKSGIWLLVISLVAFVAAGGKQWNWKITLFAVPILFFHEAGHWLAMRLFGYRNMRMFFIPLFGAAVTGRHWNVAGWKKALVSLAGPLPGIMLGVGLAAVAILTGNPNLRLAAILLVVLNGINLAPILPLDGGHFLHSILFCRNRWLDLIFRILAVVGLIVASATKIAPYMLYVGIFIAIGLPLSFKMAQVTDKFRAIPTPPMLPGEDRISPATAAPIIDAVKSALPPKSNSKTVAQYVLQVYETLNARPPSVPTTIGLLVIYAGSIGIAAITIITLIVAQNGKLRDFVFQAAMQPKHTVSSETYHVAKARGTPEHLTAPRDLIVTTCKKSAQATKLFTETKSNLPPNAALLQFGESVVLSLPSRDPARNKWFDTFQATSTNTATVVSNNSILLSLMFLAPDQSAASNLQAELGDYFNCGVADQLTPPWDEHLTSAEKARLKAARHNWVAINQELNGFWSDPSLKPLAKDLTAASRRGDVEEVHRLEKAQKEQAQKIKAQRKDEVTAKFANTPYADFVALAVELDATPYTKGVARKAVLEKVANRLGPTSPTSAPGVGALLTGTGILLQVQLANIRDPQYTLPAMMRWLSDQKCQGFKYDIDPVSVDVDGGD
jgi:Zn-dependent protease